jgi:hypothetical protein
MRLYGLRGTPSLLIVDRAGRLRAHHFGTVPDIRVGAEIGSLLGEAAVLDPRADARSRGRRAAEGRG